MKTLEQGCKYLAYPEPKHVRDANPEIEYEGIPLWVIQVHAQYYLVVVVKPDGKFDALRKLKINMDARLNSGQIEYVDDGHFESCKI